MSTLTPATLRRLPRALRPGPRPSEVGIVHFGLGAFHRAHQAVFTEEAIAAAGGDWGICGVSPRGSHAARALAAQDGLYTVLQRDGDTTTARVVGAVIETRCGMTEREHILARVASSRTQVLTMTVTEKGYLPGAAGETSVLDQILAGLRRRADADGGPITILCCDNLPNNGAVIRDALTMRAAFDDREHPGARLEEWIDEHVAFPSSVVDRITPATTEQDIAEVEELLGVRDAVPVVTEPYSSWIIADRFAGTRPAWERARVRLTKDVAPHEKLKLRLLNGSHSAISYLGALAGAQTIAEALADQHLAEVVTRLMREDVAPTLTAPSEIDLDSYQQSVMTRFRNPALHHATWQVASDGSQKLPLRLVPVVRERMRSGGRPPAWATLAIAAWMRFMTAPANDVGAPILISDPLAPLIRAVTRSSDDARSIVENLLSLEQVFGSDLRESIELTAALTDWLQELTLDGTRATLRHALSRSDA